MLHTVAASVLVNGRTAEFVLWRNSCLATADNVAVDSQLPKFQQAQVLGCH